MKTLFSICKRLLVIMLLMLLTGNLSAQDPLYSQPFANRLYLNPALALQLRANHVIRMGASGGVFYHTVDMARLRFPDQINPGRPGPPAPLLYRIDSMSGDQTSM
jgi:hypothetical protein